MYHIFFIHLSLSDLLVFFRILAVVYTPAVNTEGACVFLNYDFLRLYDQ